eukprot:1486055-Prymnesium_polylepis.1
MARPAAGRSRGRPLRRARAGADPRARRSRRWHPRAAAGPCAAGGAGCTRRHLAGGCPRRLPPRAAQAHIRRRSIHRRTWRQGRMGASTAGSL